MKGKGGLGPIVEVPSENGDSLASYRSDASELDDHRSERHTAYSDDSPFHSEDDGSQEELSDEPITNRSKSTTNKAKKGRQEVDMTSPADLLEEAEHNARRYAEKRKDSEAIREFIRCTALARIVYGDKDWRLAKSHADLAAAYFDLKGYAVQAEQHAEHARGVMKTGQMSSSSEKGRILSTVLTIFYTLGRAQAQQKKYEAAGEALSRAEEVNEQRAKLSGVKQRHTHDWDVKISLAMAKLKSRQKAYGQSVSYYKHALKVMENMQGRQSAALIPVYQGLGRVEQAKGELANHEQAIHYFQQAHEISSKREPDSVEVGDTAAALAEAYSNVEEHDAELSAESYFRDAEGVYLRHYGPHHEKTIGVQDQMARLQIRADRQEEAIENLKGTLGAKKEVYGELSAPVADTLKLLGNVYLAQQDMEKALRALKKCYNIETSLYGVNNRKTKETQRTIDILMANPNLASKHKKSKADEMKERPRFNSIVKRDTLLGGVRTDAY